MTDLGNLLVTPDISIREMMERLDRGAKGIAIVVDGDGRLLDTITDGDVRRAILSALNLDLPVQRLLEKKDRGPLAVPVSAPVGTH